MKFGTTRELLQAADKMLGCYLGEADTISEITDKVYAIGKATEIKMRKLKK